MTAVSAGLLLREEGGRGAWCTCEDVRDVERPSGAGTELNASAVASSAKPRRKERECEEEDREVRRISACVPIAAGGKMTALAVAAAAAFAFAFGFGSALFSPLPSEDGGECPRVSVEVGPAEPAASSSPSTIGEAASIGSGEELARFVALIPVSTGAKACVGGVGDARSAGSLALAVATFQPLLPFAAAAAAATTAKCIPNEEPREWWCCADPEERRVLGTSSRGRSTSDGVLVRGVLPCVSGDAVRTNVGVPLRGGGT